MIDQEESESTESNEKRKQSAPQYGSAPLALALICGLGVLAVVGYAIQSETLKIFFSVLGGGLLVGGASLLVGGLIGFLFGIPRSSMQEEPGSKGEEATPVNVSVRARYRPNTNLEEISDWLTKILVGVGLTQLSAIPSGMRDIGNALSPVLGGYPGSEMFVLGVVVYFSVCGFFISFLWTRLTLPRLYTDADLAAAEEMGLERGVNIGAHQFLESASTAVKKPQDRFTLWVDDRPQNNVRERELMERLLGLKFQNVLSTTEAIDEIKSEKTKYSLVISDMGRPGDPRAGYTLLEQLKNMGFQMPFIIYAGSNAPEHNAEAQRMGAEGSTNNPQRLLDLVRNALERMDQSN